MAAPVCQGTVRQPRCIIWSAMAGIFTSLMWRANAWTANAADDDLDMDTCQLNTFFGVLKEVRCMWWAAPLPSILAQDCWLKCANHCLQSIEQTDNALLGRPHRYCIPPSICCHLPCSSKCSWHSPRYVGGRIATLAGRSFISSPTTACGTQILWRSWCVWAWF